MKKTKLILRYPDIDAELLRLGLIDPGRLWYLSKNLADKDSNGIVDTTAAIRHIASVTRQRQFYVQRLLIEAARLYDPNGPKGLCELFPDGRLRLLGVVAVCRLLDIDHFQHAPAYMPLADLFGSIAQTRYSFYESIVRAQYSQKFVSRAHRSTDLGLSKSSTIRYDKKLNLILYNNWSPAIDDDGYVFTSNKRAPLIQQAKGKACFEDMPKYVTMDVSSCPVSLLRRIAPGQDLGNFIMLERLPSTYKPHNCTNKHLLARINNQLHTSSNTATSLCNSMQKTGRTCNRIHDMELVEIRCSESADGVIRLWVPVQKVTPALRRRVPELSRLATYGGNSNAQPL